MGSGSAPQPVSSRVVPPDPSITSAIGRHHTLVSAVADLVVDAVRNDRFWIFPHPDWLEIAMERFHSIGESINPSRPEEFPGMPPRSQMMAEVMAAMLADAVE